MAPSSNLRPRKNGKFDAIAAKAIMFNEDVTSSTSSITNDPPQVEEFTLFPKLPIELRFKIWKDSFPGPRYIEIRTNELHEVRNPDETSDHDKVIWAPLCIERAPALYFVCQEARAELAKLYKPFSGTQKGSEKVFVNLDLDYVCFISPRCAMCLGTIQNSMAKETWNSIKRIAIERDDYKLACGCRHKFQLGEMQLEELQIAVREIGRDVPDIVGFEADAQDGNGGSAQAEAWRKFNMRYVQSVNKKFPDWKPPRLRLGHFVAPE